MKGREIVERLNQIEGVLTNALTHVASLRAEVKGNGGAAPAAPLRDGETAGRAEGQRAMRPAPRPAPDGGGGGLEVWPLKVDGQWRVKVPDKEQGASGLRVTVTPRPGGKGRPFPAVLDELIDHNEYGDEIWSYTKG